MFRPPPLPRSLGAALRDVEDGRPSVRASAVADLVSHAEEHRAEVAAALIAALEDDEAKVRGAAALALADANLANEAEEPLCAHITDPALHVRQLVLTALGELRCAGAAEAVLGALDSPEPEVRFQAVMAYSRIASDHTKVIDALLRASRDEDAEVRHIALRMAEEVGDPSDDAAATDARIVERAKAMLRDESNRVALTAAIVLARNDLDAGHSWLVKAVRGELDGVDEADVSAAIELCGDRRIEKSRAALSGRTSGGLLGLREDPFAWHAKVALAQLGDERAIRGILRDLGSWSYHRRTLAAAAVGRAKLTQAREQVIALKAAPDRADPKVVQSALEALEES